MIGIYKITNLINNNAYIGLSTNIKARWSSHRSNGFNSNSQEYNYPLYRAFRKYGIENFAFEVLEELEEAEDLDLLCQKERYWIDFYDTFKNGYNQTAGGDAMDLDFTGENRPNHKLTLEDVIEIRQRWAAKKENVRVIYNDFAHKVAKTGFKKVYTWQTWKGILPELYTEENRAFHRTNNEVFANKGEVNGRAKLNDAMVRDIRLRKKAGESRIDVYKDYLNLGITQGSFRNVWYGCNWKHIVV